MARLPIFAPGSATRAELEAACERAGLPIATLEALAAEELSQVGKARRHRIFDRVDEILGTATGEEVPLPHPEGIRAELASLERDLAVYERTAAESGTAWQRERAAELADRARARERALRALLPQRTIDVFMPRSR